MILNQYMFLWNNHNMARTRIDLTIIYKQSLESYPESFLVFCKKNILRMPSLSSNRGKALAVMLNHPQYYWIRDDCDEFCRRFQIDSKDTIQLFNKHEQWGLTQSKERGKYYIPVPYAKSIKPDMRKNFHFHGTLEERMRAIDTIKQNIMDDYINVPNEKWQLGHKNPCSGDNSYHNMVLQPPIQCRHRDGYIFIDSITKMPTPKKLKDMVKRGDNPYTKDQMYEFYRYLQTIFGK